MKIIDLLNKIANGEEVPKLIKLNGYIYDYQGDDYLCFEDGKEYWLFSEGYTDKFTWLNSFLKTEVEILEEEKKIPEKIKDKYCSQISKVELAQKYNEIIDYLDYLKNKGE